MISVGQKNPSTKTKGIEKLTMGSDDVAIDTKKDEYIKALEVAFNLKKFTVVDISDCLSIQVLPEQIGDLSGLNVLHMSGCRGSQELPEFVSKLTQLDDVICDEETSHLWKHIRTDVSYVKINVVEEDMIRTSMDIFCDYTRYRRYCSPRLRRLYKSLKFTHGRGDYVKKSITTSTVTKVRVA
nr:hypothetical protein [Tanacetum cinerariifolium]